MVKRGKTKGKKSTVKRKSSQSVRAKAQAVTTNLAATKESENSNGFQSESSTKPETEKSTNSVSVNDEAPFPTEDNGNSHNDTYLTTATKLVQKPVTEKIKTTSFHTVRNLLHKSSPNLDDSTVITNTSTNVRVSVMCAVPAKDVDDDEAPLYAIRKMNGMLKSLINKIPSVKIGLWNPDSSSKNTFLKELPENVDVVEKYVYDYSRFISPGRNLYCRLNLFYNTKKTSQSEIECVIAGFKQPQIQHMSISHSDAISPVEMGTFTGSVRAMAESPDFADSFKSYFKLKHIGLWWAYPKSELAWTRDTKKMDNAL